MRDGLFLVSHSGGASGTDQSLRIQNTTCLLVDTCGESVPRPLSASIRIPHLRLLGTLLTTVGQLAQSHALWTPHTSKIVELQWFVSQPLTMVCSTIRFVSTYSTEGVRYTVITVCGISPVGLTCKGADIRCSNLHTYMSVIVHSLINTKQQYTHSDRHKIAHAYTCMHTCIYEWTCTHTQYRH